MSVIQLNLQPTESSVMGYAMDAVRATRATQQMSLNFDLASLQIVDFVLGEWKQLGAPIDQINKSLFAFGSYVGETVKRLAPGAGWHKPEGNDERVVALATLPLLAVKLADGQIYRPINHAFLIMSRENMAPNFWEVVKRLTQGPAAAPRAQPVATPKRSLA